GGAQSDHVAGFVPNEILVYFQNQFRAVPADILALDGGEGLFLRDLPPYRLGAQGPLFGRDEFPDVLSGDFVSFEPEQVAFGAVHALDDAFAIDLVVGNWGIFKQRTEAFFAPPQCSLRFAAFSSAPAHQKSNHGAQRQGRNQAAYDCRVGWQRGEHEVRRV